MKNKKLIIANIILFILFVIVVLIGRNSWGQAYKNNKNEDEVEVQEIQTVELNPTMTKRYLVMKEEEDFKQFDREELIIIELEDEEETVETVEEEMTPLQPSVETNRRTVTRSQVANSGTTSDASTSRNEKPQESRQEENDTNKDQTDPEEHSNKPPKEETNDHEQNENSQDDENESGDGSSDESSSAEGEE